MTCIVGIIAGGAVYIAGDSAGSSGPRLAVRADKKVFRKDQFVFGFTSSFRMGQILQYSLALPEFMEGQSLDHYMATSFIDAVRACLKEKGFTSIDSNKESGGCFLVGYRGRLFEIDDDFQVGERLGFYSAVGCGQDLALGALYALENTNLLPQEKLGLALGAASKFSGAVCAPFVVGSTKEDVIVLS